MDFNIHSRKANQNDFFIWGKVNYSYMFEFHKKTQISKTPQSIFCSSENNLKNEQRKEDSFKFKLHDKSITTT